MSASVQSFDIWIKRRDYIKSLIREAMEIIWVNSNKQDSHDMAILRKFINNSGEPIDVGEFMLYHHYIGDYGYDLIRKFG